MFVIIPTAARCIQHNTPVNIESLDFVSHTHHRRPTSWQKYLNLNRLSHPFKKGKHRASRPVSRISMYPLSPSAWLHRYKILSIECPISWQRKMRILLTKFASIVPPRATMGKLSSASRNFPLRMQPLSLPSVYVLSRNDGPPLSLHTQYLGTIPWK